MKHTFSYITFFKNVDVTSIVFWEKVKAYDLLHDIGLPPPSLETGEVTEYLTNAKAALEESPIDSEILEAVYKQKLRLSSLVTEDKEVVTLIYICSRLLVYGEKCLQSR